MKEKVDLGYVPDTSKANTNKNPFQGLNRSFLENARGNEDLHQVF